MWLDLFQQAQRIKVFDDFLAGFKTVQASVSGGQAGIQLVIDAAVDVENLCAGKDGGVLVEDVDQWHRMALADFIVVEVMGRSDLDATGAEFGIAVIIAHNRDASADQWQLDIFADQRLVALVFRVYCHGGIAQHGFRTGGGDDQVILAVSGSCSIGQRITQIPQ